jgi:hypothetical protein
VIFDFYDGFVESWANGLKRWVSILAQDGLLIDILRSICGHEHSLLMLARLDQTVSLQVCLFVRRPVFKVT